ncbi:MAG TPA: hypothetical protein VEG30_02045 [Terriglobales bacterium]|nr:hypothetical protein [Terriglobales bacterium]
MINHRRAIALVLAALLLPGAVWAQSSRTRKQRGPRAIAILEWTAEGPRLVPVTILVEGKYWDASSYLAHPVPMALEPETVYELMSTGESEGLFTITQAKELPGGVWFGEGRLQTKAELERPKPKAPDTVVVNTEDKPPLLRRSRSGRGGGQAPIPTPVPTSGPGTAPPSSGPTQSPAPPAPPPSGDGKSGTETGSTSNPEDQPPVLKKPAEDKSTASTDTSSQSSSPQQSDSAQTGASDDSGRPILKRGIPSGGEQAQALGKEQSTHGKSQGTTGPQQTAKTKETAKKNAPPTGIKPVMVAISDASPTAAHPYTWVWKESEKPRLTKEVEDMAWTEIRVYAKQHPEISPSGKLDDLQINAFDLNYSNEAQLVLTAKVSPAAAIPSRSGSRAKPGAPPQSAPPASPFSKPVEIYIALVARQNINGELRKVFSSVTDSRRLDVTPRLELIDAVDADGSGPGALLFRQISDRGSSYILYRVSLDAMTPLFDGAAPES